MNAIDFDIIFWKSLAYDFELKLRKTGERKCKAHHKETGSNFYFEGLYHVYSVLAEFPTELNAEALKQIVADVNGHPHNSYIRARNKVPRLEAKLQREDLARWRLNIKREIDDYTENPEKLVEDQDCQRGFPTDLTAKGLEVHIYRGNETSVIKYISNTLVAVRLVQ